MEPAVATPSNPKIQGSTGAECASTGAHTYSLTNADSGTLHVNFGAKCPDTVSDQSVTTVASARSTAVVYAIETNSNVLAKCVDG